MKKSITYLFCCSAIFLAQLSFAAAPSTNEPTQEIYSFNNNNALIAGSIDFPPGSSSIDLRSHWIQVNATEYAELETLSITIALNHAKTWFFRTRPTFMVRRKFQTITRLENVAAPPELMRASLLLLPPLSSDDKKDTPKLVNERVGITQMGYADTPIEFSYIPYRTQNAEVVLYQELLVPTASHSFLGYDKWIEVPGFAPMLFIAHRLMIAIKIRNYSSFAGQPLAPSINFLRYNPVIRYLVTPKYFIEGRMDNTINWDNHASKTFNGEIEFGKHWTKNITTTIRFGKGIGFNPIEKWGITTRFVYHFR